MLITNSSISNTRRFSPFFLTYFKHPIFPFQNFEKQNPLYQENSYVADLINKSQKDISTAANNSLNSFQEYKNQFDNKSSISKFELGDLIYIHTTQRGAMHHKFANRFKGPYIIVAFLANNNLQLQPIHGGKTICVHKNNCKKGTMRNPSLRLNDTSTPNQTRPTSPSNNYQPAEFFPSLLDDDDVIIPLHVNLPDEVADPQSPPPPASPMVTPSSSSSDEYESGQEYATPEQSTDFSADDSTASTLDHERQLLPFLTQPHLHSSIPHLSPV